MSNIIASSYYHIRGFLIAVQDASFAGVAVASERSTMIWYKVDR